MGDRIHERLTTRSFLVLLLPLSSVVFLGACKNDRAAAPERERSAAERGAERPVFGGGETQADSGRKASGNSDGQGTAPDPQRAESRKAEAAQARSRQRPSDPRDVQERGRQRAAGQAENRSAEGQSAAFLRYRPPGSRVGDPGEGGGSRAISVPDRGSVAALIQRWAETLLARDLSAHMSLYVPVLERFGSRTSVSRDAVLKEKQRILRNWGAISAFELRDVRVTRDTNGAGSVAEFRADWRGEGGTDGAAYRLKLVETASGWKIQSEEQMRVQSRNGT